MRAGSLRVVRPLQSLLAIALVCGVGASPASAGPVSSGNNFTLVAMPDQTVAAWGVAPGGSGGWSSHWRPQARTFATIR